jgi:hypothetical protein
MRNGTPFNHACEMQTTAIPLTLLEDWADLNWANDEIQGSLFCDRDKANELLLEISSELRLGRIARSRRDGTHLRTASAASTLRLVCVDGKFVNALNEPGTLDQACLATVAALRAWMDEYRVAFRES